jgi:hypothetical protein
LTSILFYDSIDSIEFNLRMDSFTEINAEPLPLLNLEVSAADCSEKHSLSPEVIEEFYKYFRLPEEKEG